MSQKTFDDFHQALLELIKKFENNDSMLKVDADIESNLIRVFGKNFDALTRAKKGIEDVSELAYTTAEHHPYWSLLYHCTQLGKISLEKWNGNLTKEEIDEIEWSLEEIKNSCKKLREDSEKEGRQR